MTLSGDNMCVYTPLWLYVCVCVRVQDIRSRDGEGSYASHPHSGHRHSAQGGGKLEGTVWRGKDTYIPYTWGLFNWNKVVINFERCWYGGYF